MSADNEQWATLLERLMQEAGAGNPAAIRQFFEESLEGEFVIPDRNSHPEIGRDVSYPNPFLSVLAVKDQERNIVPIFTRESFIAEWCGMKLPFRQLPLTRLAKLIPPDWWVCLNPGQEVEKEFSPWELGMLQAGQIDEILEDLAEENRETPFTLTPLQEEEHPQLRRALREAAQAHTEVRAVYLFRNATPHAQDRLSTPPQSLVVGISMDRIERSRAEMLVDKILVSGRLSLIGIEESLTAMWCVEGELSLASQLLSQLDPIYSRQLARDPGIIKRGVNFFTRHFR